MTLTVNKDAKFNDKVAYKMLWCYKLGTTTRCGVVGNGGLFYVEQFLAKRFTLRHKVKVNKEQWENAKSLYLAGMEWKAISNELKVSQATLQTKASREGITKVKAQMQTICTEKKTQSLEALSAIVRSKLAEDAASTIERVNGYSLEGIRDESTRETILGSVAKRSALVFGWSEQGEAASVSINLLGSMPDRISEIQVTGEPDSK